MNIKVHFTVIILFFIALYTNTFMTFLIMILIMLLHEFGHFLACLIFQRKIYKLTIIPFGGIMDFDLDKNVGLQEEFVIYIMGPMMNLLLMSIFNIFKVHNEWYEFNKYVFILNMLPILPLDGGRILEVLLCDIFNFKKSLLINNVLALMMNLSVIVLLFFFIEGYSYIMIAIYLFMENVKSLLCIDKRHFAFLLKKYTSLNNSLQNNTINAKKGKRIENQFYKGKHNLIDFHNKTISEEDYLKRKFEK